MTSEEVAVLFAAAAAGSVLNAVAGGGGFVAIAALVFARVPPLQASAITAVALWPGALTSAVAYHKQVQVSAGRLATLAGLSAAGGLAGAFLLAHTSPAYFQRLVPWLLLASTLLFAAGPRVAGRLQSGPVLRSSAATAALQFGIGLYGGYFGAGLGILLLASFAFMGMSNLQEMNGLKAVLVASNNAVAAATLVAAGLILWPQALVMVAGAVVGGYAGTHLAQHLRAAWLRGGIVVFGLALAAHFFLRQASGW